MQFRKLAAVAGSALMTGLTLAGPALAAVVNVADIGDLAGVTDSTAVMPTFVVGADAAPADVAAAINLAAYLAGNVYKTEKVAVEGAAAAADGAVMRVEIDNTTAYTRDFDLIGAGNALSLQPTTRGGRPATFLKEGKFTLSGTEYKYYEKIELTRSNYTGQTNTYWLKRGSSATEFENALKDLGFTVPADDLIYKVVFDTAVPVGSNNLTGQTIKFLGTDYTVTYSSTSKIELSPVGGAVGLKAGESATVGDYTVTCDSIATASGGTADAFITVCKGDVCSVSTGFSSGDTKELTVGTESVPVTLQSVAYGASISVLVGQTAFKLENGQALTNYPNWKAVITSSGNTISDFQLKYGQPHTSFSGTYPVLTEGEAITAPNDFFVLKNMGLESRSYYRLTAVAGTGDFNGDGTSTDEGVTLKITDPETGAAVKVWDVGGGTFSDQVTYDITNGAWVYLNSTSGWSSASTTPRIQLTEKTLTLATYNTLGVAASPTDDMILEIKEPQLTESEFQKSFTLEIDKNYQNTGVPRFENVSNALGSSVSSTENTYLTYGLAATNDTSALIIAYGGTTPKARSGGFTSDYGTKFVSADITQVVLDIPKSQTYGDLLLGREAGAVTGEVETKTPIQITFDVAKLDTEIADPSALTTDVVVMGGPAVNRLAAQLLDKTYPAKGAESGIPENAALIQVFQDAFGSGHVAVLIAGWEAEHTDLAVAAIQAGKVTQAETAVKVSGTVAAPTVEKYTAPAAE